MAETVTDVAQYLQRNPREGAAVAARNDLGFFLRLCRIRNFQTSEEMAYVERPVQVRFRELITQHRLVVAVKAREVGLTWALALILLWECWRYGPYQAIYLSQREDNAKDFITRMRWARNELPSWLGYPPEEQPTTQTRFAIETNEGKESEVRVFPSVPTAIEYWHPRRIVADEWGLIEGAVLPSALGAVGLDGSFVGMGTANGSANEHAKVYISCRDGYPDEYAPAGEQFHHFFSPWTDNPRFVDAKGQPVRPKAGAQKDTERMYPSNDRECFAKTAPGQAVYPEFRADLHVAKRPLRAIPGLPIFVGADWGNTPAAVCFQISHSGQVRILAEFQEMEPGIKRFGRILLDQFAQRWPGFAFIWWGDPSGRTRRDTDGKSCFGIMRDEFGVVMNAGLAQWTKRREAVARRLTTIVDGEPGLIVDPSCGLLIDGFTGQYHFPEPKDVEAYAAFEATRRRTQALMEEGATHA